MGREEFDKTPSAIKMMKSLARDGVEQPDSRIPANDGATSGGVEGAAPEVSLCLLESGQFLAICDVGHIDDDCDGLIWVRIRALGDQKSFAIVGKGK